MGDGVAVRPSQGTPTTRPRDLLTHHNGRTARIEGTPTMSTASTALAIRDDQTEFDEAQVATLRQLGLGKADRGDLAVLFHTSRRTGLDPFARQIYMIERYTKDGARQTIQTGIDGLRLVAQRTSERTGQPLGYEDTVWCGPDGQWVDVWLSQEPPAAAKVTVTRGASRFPAVALLSEYAARKRDGSFTSMWASKPALMLAKCAEALALRKAFPQDLSGLYTGDEMQQADNAPQQQAPAADPPAVEDMTHRREMGRLFGEAGITDPSDRLAYIGEVVGREVTDRREVTEDDAARVCEELRNLAGEGDSAQEVVEAEVVEGPPEE